MKDSRACDSDGEAGPGPYRRLFIHMETWAGSSARCTAPARLKDAVDLDAVGADLAGAVQRALEPAHVSMWINNRR